MTSTENLEAIIGVLARLLFTAAWWFAAVRLRRVWLLWTLAVAETLETGVQLSGFFGDSGEFHDWVHYADIVGHIQAVLMPLISVLYLLFVLWLVRSLRSTHAA